MTNTETAVSGYELSLLIEYSGKAAHAAGSPWEGINALDAVNLLFAAVNARRQQLRPEVHIRGSVCEGGLAPNIIPERASCEFTVRAPSKELAEDAAEKISSAAKGAELMTGAKAKVEIRSEE